MEPITTSPRTTAKDFFLWAGAMVALYWSAIAFMFLLFNYIDYSFPNTLSGMSDPYSGGLPFEMASLFVLVPLFIALIHFIRKDIRIDASHKELWVRHWGIILTLFAAGFTIAGDIIALLTAFFSGDELTSTFLLKVLVVLVVAAVGFAYFMLDLRGYWDANHKKERSFGIGLATIVLLSIIAGFFIVGTPSHARLMRVDNQRVSDLQTIQWQLVNYWQAKQELPKTLTDLADPLSGYSIPVDPETGDSYEYNVVSPTSFELCADFAVANDNPSTNPYAYDAARPVKSALTTDSWAHTDGHVCFSRTIDPERYPPTAKTAQ